jgi:hypothetical protein
MPISFSDPETVFNRAVRVWCWRKPHHGESFEQYRDEFAQYVNLSDPEEAEAIRKGADFTKFDPPVTFRD